MITLAKSHDRYAATPARIAEAQAAPASTDDEAPCAWRTTRLCHNTAWGAAGRCVDHPRCSGTRVAWGAVWCGSCANSGVWHGPATRGVLAEWEVALLGMISPR